MSISAEEDVNINCTRIYPPLPDLGVFLTLEPYWISTVERFHQILIDSVCEL